MPVTRGSKKGPHGFKLRHVLRGHVGVVNAVAWSPDGHLLASAAADRTVVIWDAETGGKLRTLRESSESACGVIAWSPDGQMLASISLTGQIEIWDTVEWRQRRSGLGHVQPVYSLAWSPDGRTLATGANDGTVRLWNVETLLLRRILGLQGYRTSVSEIEWSPDGRLIAASLIIKDFTPRGTLVTSRNALLWRAETGVATKPFQTQDEHVNCVTWSRNGQWQASGSVDAAVRLWDAPSGRLLRVLEGHTKPVLWLGFSPDSRLLVSKSADRTVRFWSCESWATVAVLKSEPSDEPRMQGVVFHPAKPVLAKLGEDESEINVWVLDYDSIAKHPPAASVNYVSAKVVLVGDSGVGKTGLGWRLAHKEFKEHPSTHGQQFWVIEELGTRRADGTECEAVLWDLAGQPDYRLVHALFLDDVDLALLLFDPTDHQEPLKGVEYWLKQLSRKGRRSRAILVGARSDRGAPTLTNLELTEFCKQFGISGGYVNTSALIGSGIDTLMDAVRASISWDEKPATVTTTTFKRVKEFVLALKEDGTRQGVLVAPSDLRARLTAGSRKWKFTNDEMMTAVGHLANHGYVTVLRSSSGAISILLVPDLLANLASSLVLEARRSPKELGALEESRVLHGGYEFTELSDMGKQERDVLLDAAVALFLEHNLCFRESLGGQTFLVFPALINLKRPVLDDVPTVDDVSYHVSGAVENVYAALVVLLGYTSVFTRTNHWQNQAQYEVSEGEVCGFRQIAEREGEIELVLYYGANVPKYTRLLFQGLFEKFLRNRDVMVTKYPPVSCPQCDYRQERAEMVKRINTGREFHFCSECGAKIVLPSAGEDVAPSRLDPERMEREQALVKVRTAFETALVRVKGAVRDRGETARTPTCFISYAWGKPTHDRWVMDLATDLQNAGIEVIVDYKDNARIGASVPRFISRIEKESCDYVIVVGTPSYREKYVNKSRTKGSMVSAEVDLISVRLTGTERDKETVLPLLLDGDEVVSLPPLLQGRVYADFRRKDAYFAALFDLILTLYNLPFENMRDLRELILAGRV
jgi:small GTP-binding protein